MKALVQDRYGAADDVLEVRDVPTPTAGAGEVLVRIEAASANMADWHLMTGLPRFLRLFMGLRRPNRPIPGSDFAGVVEGVGEGVADLAVGDDVVGRTVGGALAERVSAAAERVVPRPAGLSAEEAACIGVAPVTALQGLRDKAGVRHGEHILVIGASGGVGTFAIQIARLLGAEVTAVCSTAKVEQARALGADRVIDYTVDDFVELAVADGTRYDVVFDNPGNRTLGDIAKVMAPAGRHLMVGGPKGPWLGPIPKLIRGKVRSMFSKRRFVTFTADETRSVLLELCAMYERGELRSVISDRFPLDEAATALRIQGEGHAAGKIVVTMPT